MPIKLFNTPKSAEERLAQMYQSSADINNSISSSYYNTTPYGQSIPS
uniref:Uncharacterized protein n=1 Tax=Dulem virus 42 TaxID=3145760 RepID=A0AAU8BAN8_9CAUD